LDSGTALLSVIGMDGQVYLHQFDVNGNATGDYIRIPNPSPPPPPARFPCDGFTWRVEALHVARVYDRPTLFVLANESAYRYRLDAYGNPRGYYERVGSACKTPHVNSIGGIIAFPTPQ